MTSPADICNMALDAMSAKVTINGINPPSPPNSLAAQVASRNYQTQVDSVFRAANWSDGRYQDSLEMLGAAVGTPENPAGGALPVPPFPWLYMYAYPTDCLRMRFVMEPPEAPDSSVPVLTNVISNPSRPAPMVGAPFTPGLVKDTNGNLVKVILTNVRQALGVYTIRVDNPDLWDVLLKNSIIAALAAFFVNPIARNKDLMAERTQVAAGLILTARVADANEGVTSVDHLPDFMAVRGVGGGMWGGMEGSATGVAGSIGAPWDAWVGPDGLSY